MSDERVPSSSSPAGDDFFARILDQLLDLLQTVRDWIRQEAASVIHDTIVPPIQKLGLTLASASAAAFLLVIGLLFIAVAAIVALSQWLGVPLAFLIIGLVFVIGAGIFTFVKVKAMQK